VDPSSESPRRVLFFFVGKNMLRNSEGVEVVLAQPTNGGLSYHPQLEKEPSEVFRKLDAESELPT